MVATNPGKRNMFVKLFEKLIMKTKLPMYYGKFKPLSAFSMIGLHLLFGVAIYYAIVQGGFALPSWILGLSYFVLAGTGIGLGYHRMVAHRSFKAKSWLKNILLFNGALAQQSNALWWAAVHNAHHAHSDQPGDPHSMNDGYLWAHMLWTWFDYNEPTMYRRIKPIAQDVAVKRQRKYFNYVALLVFTVPALVGLAVGGWIGALDAFLATSVIGVVMTWHLTWSINSISHLYESNPSNRWIERFTPLGFILGFQNKDMKKRAGDRSRNNPILAIFTFGKANHANHHAQPRAAFQGWRWWDIDPNKWFIQLSEKFGWVSDVIRPNPAKFAGQNSKKENKIVLSKKKEEVSQKANSDKE
jgi:fatty-acid desaturase